MSTEKHVHLLGILHIVHSSLVLVIGIGIFMLLFGIGILSRDQDAALVLGIIGTLIAGLLVVISVPGIIGGIGVLKLKPWGRILTLIVGFLKLLDIPFGTALGVYTIWVLMREDTERLFGSGQIIVPPPVPASPVV